MSKQFNNLIYTIENAKSIIKSSTEQIQDLILNDKSLVDLHDKMKNKLIGIQKDNFHIILRTKRDYSFILEISSISESENELEIIYFRVNQDLEITDYNYKYEFQNMHNFALEIIEVLKKYYE